MKTKQQASAPACGHTPGPWVFAYGSVYREDTLHDESSIRIALMDRNEPHTMPTERDANARLIAAAPELLEALKLLCPVTHLDTCAWLNFIPGCSEREEACTCGAALARAAIAKAEGR